MLKGLLASLKLSKGNFAEWIACDSWSGLMSSIESIGVGPEIFHFASGVKSL